MVAKQVNQGEPDRTISLDYRACVTRSMLGAVMAEDPRFDSRPDQLENADIKAARVIASLRNLEPVDAIQ